MTTSTPTPPPDKKNSPVLHESHGWSQRNKVGACPRAPRSYATGYLLSVCYHCAQSSTRLCRHAYYVGAIMSALLYRHAYVVALMSARVCRRHMSARLCRRDYTGALMSARFCLRAFVTAPPRGPMAKQLPF